MKIVVTGGAGFIGSHVVDALCNSTNEVIVVDSLDPEIYSAPPAYLNERAKYCVADLRNFRDEERFADVEAIVHLAALGGVSRAARQRENVLTANAGGTARLLEVARGWKKLRHTILCSSFSVYGSNYRYRCRACGSERNGDRLESDLVAGRFEVACTKCGGQADVIPIDESTTPNPLETYGSSKYMQELCFRGFDAGQVTILRFSSVYGARLRLDDGEATIIAKIAGWIRNGVRPRLLEDGRQLRDWVLVSDVVDVVRQLLAGAAAPPVINVCSGVPTTLVEACEAIARALGRDCPPDIVGGHRKGDMRHCLGNPSTVRSLLGRDPVPFLTGAGLAFAPDA
ncbi:MAG: NAD-dependent epimerase/dehydratase family protein [Polyangiaceae bacterium]